MIWDSRVWNCIVLLLFQVMLCIAATRLLIAASKEIRSYKTAFVVGLIAWACSLVVLVVSSVLFIRALVNY